MLMFTWEDFHRHDRLHEYIVVGLMQRQQQQHTKVATSELADVGCQDVMAHIKALAKKERKVIWTKSCDTISFFE
jgi:hypothetical protein